VTEGVEKMYEFKGWDWTELAECWGCELTGFNDDEAEKFILDYLFNDISNGDGKFSEQTQKDIYTSF
jgi:hypothetical protein